MKNLDITDWGKEGEFAHISYFYGNDPEARLDVEFERLVDHVAYEGLNEGGECGFLMHTGEWVERSMPDQDPEIWTEENLKEALEYYLIHTLKNKS